MPKTRGFQVTRQVGATLLVLSMLFTAVYAAPTFTGHAPADFTDPDIVHYADTGGIGDVGLPANAPPGTISGWDMAGVYFDYDFDTDTMYVGIDCGGSAGPSVICGDADGDGDPSTPSSWLVNNSGNDTADLSATESICILIDTDQDGNAEVAVGVHDNADMSSFAAYNRQPLGFVSPFSHFFWGSQLPNAVSYYQSPSITAPDLEFSIEDFSTLPNFSFTPGDAFCFDTLAYAGSQEDDGVGEDSVGPTEICLTPPTAVTLSSFTAAPAGRAIQLEWQTASELDNLGFNLYRATSAAGPWTQLNEGLIPGQAPGSPVGATYTFTDEAVESQNVYYYRLESVDVTGQSEWHGPVETALKAYWRPLLRPRLDVGVSRR